MPTTSSGSPLPPDHKRTPRELDSLMLSLLPIIILLLAALIMLGIRVLRPDFRQLWLLAMSGVFLAWIFALIAKIQLPASITLVNWQPEELFPVSPALVADNVSWSFSFSLISLALVAILIDVTRITGTMETSPIWWNWTPLLTLTALGVLTVMSYNFLTLVFTWAALDTIELIIWLSKSQDSIESRRAINNFAVHLASILLVLMAGITMRSSGSPLDLTQISKQASLLLLAAAGLRLGIQPVNTYLNSDKARDNVIDPILRLIPSAAGLALLVRTANTGAALTIAPFLLLFVLIAATISGFLWNNVRDELEGAPLWIMGMAAFVFASAVRSQPEAGLAWGIALLLTGGLVFLFIARRKWLLPLLMLGLFGFSTLPFSPAWQGVLLYQKPLNTLAILFIIPQGLFLAGYYRHATRRGDRFEFGERWVWFIYPLGLALLPAVQFIIVLLGQVLSTDPVSSRPTLIESWPGVAACAFALLILLLQQRGFSVSPRVVSSLRLIISPEWIYRSLRNVHHSLGRLFNFFSATLEGRGGILWSILLLTLLISLLSQFSIGR
ncbi:hypothetical protein ACFLV7_08080 [Chloroflexota bacterium]